MKRRTWIAPALAAATCLAAAGCATGPNGVVPAAIRLPDLPAPENPADKAYLGLPSDAATFAIEDIPADMLIIEVFDLYCMLCLKAAPEAARLYALIGESPHKDRIRMIGLGRGNTALEAGLFHKKTDMPFPALPDPDRVVTDALGHEKTPEFIVLRRTPEGRFGEIFRHRSFFRDAGRTFERILRDAGWK